MLNSFAFIRVHSRFLFPLLLLCSSLTGCLLGPNYQRPRVHAPHAYREPAANEPAKTATPSFGEQKWWEIFHDRQLQNLIHIALRQNYDARIAATRILEAEDQLGIVSAPLFPFLSANGSALREQLPLGIGHSLGKPPIQSNVQQLGVALNWQLDFWGAVRRATEASRARLLASEWARREVLSTLVSQVAAAYFQLRELDLELEISSSTLASRQDSLHLTQFLMDHGSATLLDVRQAEQLVFTASAKIPDVERQIAQQENYISILLGENPATVARGLKLTEQPHAPQVPAGLPSALLERRPDIVQAEQQLVALNAQIGVAKAAFFPQISLTAAGGCQNTALSELFTSQAGLWSYGVGFTQPIFQGGQIWFGYKLAKARQQEAVLVYQRTIQQAFREVSDALIAYRKGQEFRRQQQLLTHSARDAAQLSTTRYKGGVASYLEVLTNETNAFAAELGLAQAQLSELLAFVQIYQALGGGW